MARNAGTIATAVGALQNGDATAVETLTQGMVGGIAAATQPDIAAPPPQVQVAEADRWIRPRAIREVLARLDDDASEAFDGYLDTLDEASFDRVCESGTAIANSDERVSWAQELLRAGAPEAYASAQTAAWSSAELPDVPPALFPVLAQLMPEERTAGAQLLLVLDRASVDAFTKRLAAMSPEKALKAIREAIAEAQRRSASVAHRAVAAAMRATDAEEESAGDVS